MDINIGHNDPDIGKRLDLYLALRIPQITRSNIKKTIEENRVRVNSEICYKAGYKVREGDRIEFPNIETKTYTKLNPSPFTLEIIHEDDDYLFLNKPFGLSVHPSNLSQTNTLVNQVISYYKNLPRVDLLRPGIVHRLDKETSGVIVIAKSSKGLWWLSNQFAERKVHKEYISMGLNLDMSFKYKAHDRFVFEGFLSRNIKDRKKIAVFHSNHEGNKNKRFSKSEFEVQEVIKSGGAQVIFSKIFPLTGRTHQIRVHQKELGFPIIGDKLYLSQRQLNFSNNLISDLNVVNRMYLHAYCVTFENYNGKVYSICTQIPSEFEGLINEAKEKSENKKYTK